MLKSLRNKGAWDKLTDLTENIKVCMFCTTDVHGNMRSRPMTALHVDEEGDIWFFANSMSDVCAELGEEGKVCLSYANTGKNDYLSVSGHAMLVRDKAKSKELWSPMLKAWFPGGHSDPELVLIRVRPEAASYWDNNASKMVELFSMIKAAVTGKPYADGDHGDLKL
jgi:general stress protein 26